MLARYLLVFAFVALSLRGLYFMYIDVLKVPFVTSQSVERPSNRKISYEARSVSVGTAKSKSRSSISTKKAASQSQTDINTSYASYRAQNRRVR